jgi:hypothetical protein
MEALLSTVWRSLLSSSSRESDFPVAAAVATSAKCCNPEIDPDSRKVDENYHAHCDHFLKQETTQTSD